LCLYNLAQTINLVISNTSLTVTYQRNIHFDLFIDRYGYSHPVEFNECNAPTTRSDQLQTTKNKKLSCHREAARCFMSLDISPQDNSRSLKLVPIENMGTASDSHSIAVYFAVSTQYTKVTDRQTDGRTNTTRRQAALMHSITRKNEPFETCARVADRM